MNNSPLFVPSSSMLLSMIVNAERKCDGDREQFKLRAAARAEAREVRREVNAAKARGRIARWGV